jgi:transposase
MTERAMELVSGLIRGHQSDGRCRYDAAAKAELVRRCLHPGVSVAAMALAHGVNANLLRKWITQSVRQGAAGDVQRATLLPVIAPPVGAMRPSTTGDARIEIVLPAATIRLCGEVSARSLQLAIDCLSRRS